MKEESDSDHSSVRLRNWKEKERESRVESRMQNAERFREREWGGGWRLFAHLHNTPSLSEKSPLKLNFHLNLF